MISRPDAFILLKSIVTDEQKLTHAVHVAEMMEALAHQFHLQAEKWYLTGLLHDIDIPSIGEDWSRHGIEAQKILAGRLPDQAMKAIEAHDRHAGVKSDSKISWSLRLADVVDNLSHHMALDELKRAMQAQDFAELERKLPDDLLNLQVIEDFARRWPEIRIE